MQKNQPGLDYMCWCAIDRKTSNCSNLILFGRLLVTSQKFYTAKFCYFMIHLVQGGEGEIWCSVDSDFMISRPIAALHGPLHLSSCGLAHSQRMKTDNYYLTAVNSLALAS